MNSDVICMSILCYACVLYLGTKEVHEPFLIKFPIPSTKNLKLPGISKGRF